MICPGCGLELEHLGEHFDSAHPGVTEDELKQEHPKRVTPGVTEGKTEKSEGGIFVVREKDGPYL